MKISNLFESNNYYELVYYDDEHRWHRDDGPAVVNTKTGESSWCQHGKRHREDGPALSTENERNEIEEIWMIEGQIHRDDGPAVIVYDRGLNIIKEQWYQYDKIHREDGPALIYHPRKNTTWYDAATSKPVKYWCLNGVNYGPSNYPTHEYNNALAKLKEKGAKHST